MRPPSPHLSRHPRWRRRSFPTPTRPPGQHGSTQHLRPQLATEVDTIYAASIVSARLQPGLMVDADAIFTAAIDTRNALRPAPGAR
jgi:hypothetical protein